jgi:hypothetical protein
VKNRTQIPQLSSLYPSYYTDSTTPAPSSSITHIYFILKLQSALPDAVLGTSQTFMILYALDMMERSLPKSSFYAIVSQLPDDCQKIG